MAAIPTLEEEDAKRPTRQCESRVNERSRIVNRIKEGCPGGGCLYLRNIAVPRA